MQLDGQSKDVATAWLQGDILCILGYGMDVVLFIFSFTLLRRRSAKEKEKIGSRVLRTTILEIYNTLIFILCTIASTTKMSMMQSSFVNNVDYQNNPINGPGAYQEHLYTSIPIGLTGNVACAITNWMVGALLIWRCYVIYCNSKTAIWCLVLVPGALMIASFVSGVVYLDKIHNKRASPFNVPGHTIAITYGAICLMLNLVLTFMITMRLLLYRRSIKRLIGPKCAGQYTSIISIMIESGSVLDITVVSMVVLVAVNSPWVTLPLLSLTEVEAIAAFMIIIRVAKGIAWSSGTANELIAQHASARRTTSETDIRSVVEPFRITSQMTQMSAAFNFNHPHAVSTLLLTRDLPSRVTEKNTSSEMSSSVSEAQTRPSTDLQGYPKTGRSSSGKGENNVGIMAKASDPSAP